MDSRKKIGNQKSGMKKATALKAHTHNIYIYIYIHTYIRTYIHTHTYTYTYTYTQIHIHIHTHTHTHTHTYTYTYTYTPISELTPSHPFIAKPETLSGPFPLPSPGLPCGQHYLQADKTILLRWMRTPEHRTKGSRGVEREELSLIGRREKN